MSVRKLRIHLIISFCPFISVFTFFIYPLTIIIELIVNFREFKNQRLVLWAIILNLLGVGFYFVTFIMAFKFKPKEDVEYIDK